MLNVRERRKLTALNEVRAIVERVGKGLIRRELNVHPVTVDRWLDGRSTPSQADMIAMRAVADGRLPSMSKAWRGWVFKEDVLYDDCNVPHSVGDIRAQAYERQLIELLQNKVAVLEQRLAQATKGGLPSANDGDVSVKLKPVTLHKAQIEPVAARKA